MITVCNTTDIACGTSDRRMAELKGQFAESRKLEKAIRSNLGVLGYGW